MNKEIFIYEDIGGGGITAKNFELELKSTRCASGDTIHVRLNSGGGSVFDGIAIYNALRRHPAKKIVSVDGLAASAASLIAMAGDKIDIAESAFLMIHDPWAGNLAGNAKELRKVADDLERTKKIFVDAYIGRSRGKLTAVKCKELMDAETWLTAQEAVKYGLADTITEPLSRAAHVNIDKFGYRNAPECKIEPCTPRARLRTQELIIARMKAKEAGRLDALRWRMEEQTAAVESMMNPFLDPVEEAPLTESDFEPGGRGWEAVARHHAETAFLEQNMKNFH